MKKKTSRKQITQIKTLIEHAIKVRQNSIAPWTGVKVGAAILTAEGKIYDGTNFQSQIPDGSICAERCALFKALSKGERKFTHIAVVGFQKEFIYPCGHCRQVLIENAGNLTVITANLKGKYKTLKLKTLTPNIPIIRNKKLV